MEPLNSINPSENPKLAFSGSNDVAAIILQNITDGFYVVDEEWRFTYMNPKAGSLLNRDPNSIQGKILWEEYPALVGTVFEEMFHRVRRTRNAESITAFYAHHKQWYEVNSFAIPTGIAVYFRDASDAKQAAKELKTSEERRRMALDAAELGAWHVDPATMSLQCDDRFRTIFGISSREVTFEQAVSVIHPDDRSRVREAVDAAIRPDDPAPYSIDYRVVHPDGSFRWVFAKGRSRFDSMQKLISFDGTIADVTERKRMEEELRDIAADLSEADHRKNQFLAMLAHELRNPLAPISNALQLIHRAVGNTDIVLQAAAMMDRHVRHMVRLVDDLLDVSRISHGKIELRLANVELSTIIQQAVEASGPAIERGGHEVTISLPDQSVHLNADEVRLSQIFSNLLNNSSKYSEPNGKIFIVAEIHDEEVSVSVRDTGVGIAPDMLPKVFEMFSQVDRTLERSQGGLGIGLSLVQSLTEMHGGSVTAKSGGLGHGSEFIVRLPVAKTNSARPLATRPVIEQTQPIKKVLVVDDNRDSAVTLSMILQLWGHQTAVAHDGMEAISVAESFRPDVIFLDIGLPKLNGYEVARKIREQPWSTNTILVALTGWAQEEDRQRATNAGFNRHCVKPVDHNEISELLS